MNNKVKIVRTSTVPDSLESFCRGLFLELKEEGYEIIAVSSPGASLRAIGRREGIKVYPVKMERRIAIFKDLQSLWKLYWIFRKEKPRMIHSITPKSGLLSMISGWLAGVPIRVHTFTGLIFPTSKGLIRHVLMTTDRLTSLFATHVVPEGEGVKRDLIKHKITRKPLNVLGYGNLDGVDLAYFNGKKIDKEDFFTFIFIGRLVKDKGVKELVEAFKKLNVEMPATRLLLIGKEEPEEDPLDEETVRIIKNTDSIIATGYQTDVRPWLAVSDVLVLPSYREGFPNVVLEAGAMSLPSIVTNINGANEIIEQGKNGLIIPPKDREALFLAMKDMAGGKYDLQNLGKYARENVERKFNQSYVRTCLKTFYNQILNAPK